MSEREKLCYLAGLMDGEGSFFWMETTDGRRKRRTYPFMAIGQLDVRMLEWVKSNYGGSIQHQRARPEKNRKEYHVWKLQGRKAQELAKRLMPYLTIKHEKARALIRHKTTNLSV